MNLASNLASDSDSFESLAAARAPWRRAGDRGPHGRRDAHADAEPVGHRVPPLALRPPVGAALATRDPQERPGRLRDDVHGLQGARERGPERLAGSDRPQRDRGRMEVERAVTAHGGNVGPRLRSRGRPGLQGAVRDGRRGRTARNLLLEGNLGLARPELAVPAVLLATTPTTRRSITREPTRRARASTRTCRPLPRSSCPGLTRRTRSRGR